MTDIVERLQAVAEVCEKFDMVPNVSKLQREAADEIERLRSELSGKDKGAGWIKTSERLPTEDDADEDGFIWVSTGSTTSTVPPHLFKHDEHIKLFPFWFPRKKNYMPDPPEEV